MLSGTPLCLAMLCLFAPRTQARPTAFPFQVASGFECVPAAAAGAVRFPMFAAFDDRYRLFVAESSGGDLYAEISSLTRKCGIKLLEDKDGDGVYESVRIFADKLVFPMGLAWREGRLYVADPPDLITLEDTDGDGRADKKTVILTGFGHKDNGSLHGLTFGPDGLLYLTMGEPDGYRLRRKDGTFLAGRTGALIRCRQDGSNPEVLSSGFANLVEVVFTLSGECVGTDNWFQLPAGGQRDALVQLVPGGLYPMNGSTDGVLPWTGGLLPAIKLYPAVALSGLIRYEGSFPGPGQCLFSAQHNARKVVRHLLHREGAGFRVDDFDFVTTDNPDFHPADVIEDVDGSLIVVDTGSWYVHHCPTGRIRNTLAPGGLFRVRRLQPGGNRNDPKGTRLNWEQMTPTQECRLLDDPRPMVRDRVRRKLLARGGEAVAALDDYLHGPIPVTARQRALWVLAVHPVRDASAAVRSQLAQSDPDILSTAIRVLTLRQEASAEFRAALGRLIVKGAPPVQLAAAEALARCGDSESVPLIFQSLLHAQDPLVKHASIHALHALADTATLQGAIHNGAAPVQRAAMILLDQPPRARGSLRAEQVLAMTMSADAELRSTALAILQRRPEWAVQANRLFQDWLEKRALSSEELAALGSLVIAFQSDLAFQNRVAGALIDRNNRIAVERREAILNALPRCSLAALPAAWVEALAFLIRSGPSRLQLQAVRIAGTLGITGLAAQMAQLAEDRQTQPAIRLEALRGVMRQRRDMSPNSFGFLLDRLDNVEEPLGRLAAAEILGQARLDSDQTSRLLQALRRNNLVSPAVVLPVLKRSVTATTLPEIVTYLRDAISTGWRPNSRELQRDLEELPGLTFQQKDSLLKVLNDKLGFARSRLVELESLSVGGSAEHGRKVFWGKKAACSACHGIGKDGGDVGPDLTRVGAVRTARDLVESIAFPSSTLAQGFESHLAVLADGRVATGIIARQDAQHLVLREASGALLRLPRDQLQDLRRLETSLMPDGLDRILSAAEFRDLLSYLQSLK